MEGLTRYGCTAYSRLDMNDVQIAIEELTAKGWTVQAIASAIGAGWSTVERWKLGLRQPANGAITLAALRQLGRRKPPARKRKASGG